ncbi:major facilitator superfamily domain-containing protein [Xylaria sp. CBS 124048]|nr:major facilitator superfamily domain-containing protein [Xylaria sp. CBS 124048]
MEPMRFSQHGPSPAQTEQILGREDRGSGEVKRKNDTLHLQLSPHKSKDESRGVQAAQDVEKRPASVPGPPVLTRDSEIEYLYLTFDTVIPEPDIPPGTPESAAPRRPNLSRYIDPMRWSKAQKDVTLALACVAAFLTAYAAGAYSPPVELIVAELHTTREVALLGVTTFCLGFAYTPMVLAPFSEFTGRYPVFAVAGVGLTLFQAVSGVVTTSAGILISRFFEGVASSVYSTIASGVLADIYHKEDRNTPMALFCGFVLAGTGLGPLVSSVIVGELGSESGQKWKWVFWHQVIVDFVIMVAIWTLFKESRGSVVLSKKAKALNKWYEQLEAKGFVGAWVQEVTGGSGISDHLFVDYDKQPPGSPRPRSSIQVPRLRRIRWKTRADEERGSLVSMISISLTRPFHFLFTEPIVFFFSLWVSFAWAILYLMFSSITLVFNRQYDFNVQQSGYVFGAMVVGSILATMMGIFQEDLLRYPGWQAKSTLEDNTRGEYSNPRFWAFIRRRFPAESSESRLYFTCFSSVLLPAGLYLFGFSARPDIHWMVPTTGIGLATAGIYSVYLATFNYFADSYQAYASSATAAQSFCRNVLAGVFPLITSMLWTNLGEANAGATLGSIAAVFTIIPWALVFYGETIRSKSKYAIKLEAKSM